MTTADEVAGQRAYERERRDADREYNDALTALDRAIVHVTAQPSLAPDDLARLTTSLILFLQRITAFVDTKDREIAANTNARMAALERGMDAIAELRQQMATVQRAVGSRQSSVVSPQSTVASPQSAAASPEPSALTSGHLYVAFEDLFRGSDDAIAAKLRAYVPIFAGAATDGAAVVDLGCGRGELVAALDAAGIRARGVDANDEMVAVARGRGLDVAQADALAFLETIEDGSLGGIVATQVIEHLEPQYLMRLLETAARTLKGGAPIVLETINPACWLAFFSSYIRDITHAHPIHPETLQYLLRANGFQRVELRYSAPVPEHTKMKTVDLPAGVRDATDPAAIALAAIAHTINANAVILNNLMFTHLDYAAIGYRS